ncbi:MAG: DUF1501 domain-containing protein [Gemmataceae bacterium]
MTALTRRQMLGAFAHGFGSLALTSLLAEEARGEPAPTDPLAPRKPHFEPKARRVIFLFMHGGVSHVDTFDPKPKLAEMNGKPLPIAKPKFEFAPTGNLLASPWKFRRYAKCDTQVSELFPHIGAMADDICVVRSVNGGNEVSHGPAMLRMNTGDGVFNRPSLGAWTLYGLGTENRDLPGFLSFSPSLYHGGAQNYGSAFLPASYQGTRVGDGSTPFAKAKLANATPTESADLQRLQLDLLSEANREHQARSGADARLEARIATFELAFRMQASAPTVFDLSRESDRVRQSYGIDAPETDEFGRQCLLARRLVEAGVRFVQVNHGYPRNYWDAHGGLRSNHSAMARRVDQPIAALLADLKQRGLLADTLVVFGTEFGRTPAAQGNDGRDHHPHAFSMWLAGSGVKGGITYGTTDDFGYYVAEHRVTIPDLHATILHLLGLDHTKLTYRHAGRDYRLTDVHGDVVKAILA